MFKIEIVTIKIDVSFYLENKEVTPYRNPNNTSVYIYPSSNHSGSVFK